MYIYKFMVRDDSELIRKWFSVGICFAIGDGADSFYLRITIVVQFISTTGPLQCNVM